VRWSRDALGRDRIWYSIDEIESIMDDEARKAGLTPTTDQPAVNLEAFLERHLDVALDQHATLPIDVLGQTIFEPGLPVRVEINADLTGAIDDGGRVSDVGRWRATFAHEAAHILLHRVLFEVPLSQGKLFEDEEPATPPTLMRCLKRDVAPGRGASDWREVQANRGMAALLMPRKLFSTIAAEERMANKLPPFPLVDGSDDGDRLVRRLAARFDVSRQAAQIRLRTLGLLADPSATALGLSTEV
jgi:hypothetical protein